MPGFNSRKGCSAFVEFEHKESSWGELHYIFLNKNWYKAAGYYCNMAQDDIWYNISPLNVQRCCSLDYHQLKEQNRLYWSLCFIWNPEREIGVFLLLFNRSVNQMSFVPEYFVIIDTKWATVIMEKKLDKCGVKAPKQHIKRVKLLWVWWVVIVSQQEHWPYSALV